ncbi:MAG: PIN domain-containing protein [Desulfovibrio sp.]|jgi:tRNA(fMet)-specific endonuclease VapC|nr:PIN domain-containing protein [Desulfovibrio sp.]
MRVLLDTNICIYMIKNKPPEVRKHFEQFVPGDIAISSITVAELRYGKEFERISGLQCKTWVDNNGLL